MATGRPATPSGNATLAAQEHHRNTNGKLYLIHLPFRQSKPDMTTESGMTAIAKTKTMMTGNTRTSTACRLHRPETETTTRIRMPPTSFSLASATTSAVGASGTRR